MSASDLSIRFDRMIARLRAVIDNNQTMSVEGQAIAIGMVVTVCFATLEEAADVLRERSDGR